jgi:hypothetical protein
MPVRSMSMASNRSPSITRTSPPEPIYTLIDKTSHEHIGQGYIGTTGFELLLNDRRLSELPMVVETPKDDHADRRNLQALRSLIHERTPLREERERYGAISR